MDNLLAAARAVHFASALLLFGELAFALVVARPGEHDAAFAAWRDAAEFRRRLRVIGPWSLAASIVSGLAWLACEAGVISGLPLEQALNRATLAAILGKTAFGRLWILRLCLAIGLAALLWARRRRQADPRERYLAVATFGAAAYLATLAWAGHAAGGTGSERYIQLASDGLHLLAAGAWLGALPGLVLLLRSRPSLEVAAQAARRFSALGLTSVSALAASGLVNTWYLVGDLPGLFGTAYGRLLIAKLTLFGAMLTLAAANRLVLTPRLAQGSHAALASLRRNALLEVAAGIAIVAIVGVLGIRVPAAHQAPVWPFPYTLSLEPAYEAIGRRTALAFAAAVALAAAGVVLRGFRARRSRLWIPGFAAFFVALSSSVWLLAVPAYPTTYAESPAPYTTDSIIRGAALYARICSICHGPAGRGDGVAAASLNPKPADLAEHATLHRPGELFWRIAHGVPGTPMPGFAPGMSDQEIWNLVQLLHALSDAEAARVMTGRLESRWLIVAPDFTFELAGQEQESLSQQRGRRNTLLVFYTLPQSLPRLAALTAELRAYKDAGTRVIAVPMQRAAELPRSLMAQGGDSMLAVTGTDVPEAYAMFERESGDGAIGAIPPHAELLVDRQGYLRARWIGLPEATANRTAQILSRIASVEREPAPAAARRHHAH